ncbi:E3 CR1-b [Human adenovirus 67]|uniref:E3 CR1-b n=1 Tax=Human adenovirus 67 TaxID=1101371 RepID=H5T763_9ADEN|nr:E3 CR1-b [Human adenovirus 67]
MKKRKNCYNLFLFHRTMNALTSVVLLSLLVAFSNGEAETVVVNVKSGTNHTLEGPRKTPVQWYGGANFDMFCNGSKIHHKELNHTCSIQNITLTFINRTHHGTYYGFGYDNQNSKVYHVRVDVEPPRPRATWAPPQDITIKYGSNRTLQGPSVTPVSWYDGEGNRFCDGDKIDHTEINHTCNAQNLTLLFVNETHERTYYGISGDWKQRNEYDVTVTKTHLNIKNLGQRKTDENHKNGMQQKVEQKPSKRPKQKTLQTTIQVMIPIGTNYTLVGPSPPVSWHTTKNGLTELCNGNPILRHTCDGQNITLINVNATFEADYYGSNNKSESKHYRVKVFKERKDQALLFRPLTTKGSMIITTENQNFELQKGDNQDDDKIPSTTVAIVVGVIAGFVTLIIVFICYICCRKRPRTYNHMVDPLLSFSY